MRRATVLTVMAALVAAPGAASLAAYGQGEFSALEAEAAGAILAEGAPFTRRAILAERLRSAAARAPAAEQRARLTLSWLRAVQWVLASMPFNGADRDPERNWLVEHQTLVTYSDPAGEWLLLPDAVWREHDAHQNTTAAEALAWLAVTNGYPGECEGYVPCYANVANWLSGEYLRRHPSGLHAAEAVERIAHTLEQALTLLSRPDARDFLNPATDCADLRSGLDPLRRAVTGSRADGRAEVTRAIDRLAAYCP